MDRKFLEFWGNALLNAAKGQEQVENLSRLARDGFKTFEQQLNLFQKLYNLDKKPDAKMPDPAMPYTEMWAKAAADFAKSYQEFLGFMGVVPREDYEALSKEHEALKIKFAALEEKLRHSSAKSGGKEIDPTEVVKGFEGLMQKQTEQFQTLVASYGKLYEEKKPARKSTEPHSPEEPSRKTRKEVK